MGEAIREAAIWKVPGFRVPIDHLTAGRARGRRTGVSFNP
jgi:hypothetical protein